MLVISMIAAFIILFLTTEKFMVYDGVRYYAVRSYKGDTNRALALLNLDPGDYNLLKTEKSDGKTVITIERKFPVTVVSGDKKITVSTGSATVEEILKLAGIKTDQYDMVEPSLDTVITKKSVIDFMDIDYTTEECTEIIPYEVKMVFTNALSSGQTVVSRDGANGLKLVNYTCKTVNGKVVERLATSEQVLFPAVGGVRTVGTGGNASITTGVAVTSSNYTNCYSTLSPVSPIPLDENGVPTNYTNHIRVQATAYTYTGFRTATGKPPQPGYVAVNPNIIPYGTRMYIVSSDGNWIYGYAEAADTGGFTASNPTNIDLFFATYSQCISFGRRDIEVYFLP